VSVVVAETKGPSMNKVLAAAASLALVLAACAAPSTTGATDVSVPDELVSPVEQAVSDLETRLGPDVEITVVRVEDVMWSDGSLGCPQPGMSYTQAIVDGYRIELSDGVGFFAYHGAVGRDPFLCETDDRESAGSSDASASTTIPSADRDGDGPVGDIGVATYDGPLGDLVTIAVVDLAQREDVLLDDIVIISAESVVWPDGSLGCPQPDMAYAQVQIDGARIILSIDGGIFTYHSGGTRDPFLCVPHKSSGNGTTGLTLPGVTDPDE
jgi:hypothetical protein